MYNIYRETRKRSSRIIPIICLIMPFVGHKNPSLLPFVERNGPFVDNKGFTLIELIVTLTVAGILMGVAAPSMFNFLASSRLTSQVNELITDISLSRSEAIKRNAAAGICVSTSGTSCTTGGNWANGWLVYYVDDSGVSPVNMVIKTHEPLAGNNTLTAPADSVVYAKSGLVSGGTGQFTLCDPQLHASRLVTVNNTGRPTISAGNC